MMIQQISMDATICARSTISTVKKMSSEKIDCAKFLTWFIENYPQSAEQTRKADISFWGRFK